MARGLSVKEWIAEQGRLVAAPDSLRSALPKFELI
jgi:hypothetical protein